jgi:hypothetical protein
MASRVFRDFCTYKKTAPMAVLVNRDRNGQFMPCPVYPFSDRTANRQASRNHRRRQRAAKLVSVIARAKGGLLAVAKNLA